MVIEKLGDTTNWDIVSRSRVWRLSPDLGAMRIYVYL